MKIKTGSLTSLLFGDNIEKTVKDAKVDLKKLEININSTAIININTINGYFHDGAMFSPRLAHIVPKIEKVNKLFEGAYKLFFVDAHETDSTELKDYPTHCTTANEQLVIKKLRDMASETNIFYTNSTNGFITKKYAKWLSVNNKKINTIIITGGMSDISILQYALTQKAYFNNIDRINTKVIVVSNAVQTYDNETHVGDLMQCFALYNMYLNGIIIAEI